MSFGHISSLKKITVSQVECWSDPFCLRGVRGKLITTTLCVSKMFLLVFPDSHRPAHTVNILNKFLIERKTYEHFVLWVGRKSLPCRGQ